MRRCHTEVPPSTRGLNHAQTYRSFARCAFQLMPPIPNSFRQSGNTTFTITSLSTTCYLMDPSHPSLPIWSSRRTHHAMKRVQSGSHFHSLWRTASPSLYLQATTNKRSKRNSSEPAQTLWQTRMLGRRNVVKIHNIPLLRTYTILYLLDAVLSTLPSRRSMPRSCRVCRRR